MSRGDIGVGEVELVGKASKRRIVPVPQELCNELRALVGLGADDAAPVFVSCFRNRMKPRALRGVVAGIGERALGRRVNPRMLRHAHTTHALEAGAPVHHVQRCLGHATLHTTSVYVDASPGANSAKYLTAQPCGRSADLPHPP